MRAWLWRTRDERSGDDVDDVGDLEKGQRIAAAEHACEFLADRATARMPSKLACQFPIRWPSFLSWRSKSPPVGGGVGWHRPSSGYHQHARKMQNQ